jgi:hypothetical protein
MRKMIPIGWVSLALLVLLGLVASGPPTLAARNAGLQSDEPAEPNAAALSLGGATARMGRPAALTTPELDAPVAPTVAQVAARRAHMVMVEKAWEQRTLPSGGAPEAANGPETLTSEPGAFEVQPNAPGTFATYSVRALAPPSGYSSTVSEPAVSQSGKYAFVTHNWYAARTVNGGNSWTYRNPYADFRDFCCDQDTVYDRGRDLFLWYRQGIIPAGQSTNQFKLGVSTNQGASWCTYTLSPPNVDATWTGRWFDYPHLEVGNDYLYMTTNIFTTTGNFDRMLLLRWPLDSLASCAGFTYQYYWQTAGWTWTPATGATDVMYLGDHWNTSTMALYSWPENTTTMTSVLRGIAGWTYTNRDGNCPVLGGRNPCARADQRILAGWIRNGELGFFWNVRENLAAGFPYPYVEAATFNPSGLVYSGRPLVYNSSGAWHWASAAPNDRGDLGIATHFFSSSTNPTHYVGVDDGYNGAPPGWEVYNARSSTDALPADNWGDYLRVRSFAPQGVGWVATGHTIQRVGRGIAAIPHVVHFGRERDRRGYDRFKLN